MEGKIWPITVEDVEQARERLRPFLPSTPLRNYPPLDAAIGLRTLVKHENHLPTNSFKVRNALAALTALSPEERSQGVITATRGNHGQGLAWAGKLLGVPVTICVPVDNNPEKNEAMRGWGAELIEGGQDYDAAVARMQRLAAERGLRPLHSTNDAAVLAGAGTLTLEILEQAEAMGESLDALVVSIGGGSQAVGAMTVLRQRHPGVCVYGVQAERASAIHDSWHAGRVLTGERADSFADGIATRMPYAMTFAALQAGLEDFVLVSEEEIARALRLLLRTTHNLAEGAGAAGLAGLQKLAPSLVGKTVTVVLSGSNIDAATLQQVISEQI